MVDFGSAKILSEEKGYRTSSLVGTPHYMCPELLSGKGYSFPADIWSLGICIFEYLCGYVPFGEKKDDPFLIYEEIVKNEIKYPEFIKEQDPEAIFLIDQLLSKSPEIRLKGSFISLKTHE